MTKEMSACFIALLALLALSSATVCVGTASVPDCFALNRAKCSHSYQLLSSGVVSPCNLGVGDTCRNFGSAIQCTPLCNGTILIAACSSAPRTYCGGYYQTTSAGSVSCVLNPSTNKCVVPANPYYCSPTGSVVCNGQGYAEGWSCEGFTTQATCTASWMGPFNGQKNQCQWDPTYNVCYLGAPCHY